MKFCPKYGSVIAYVSNKAELEKEHLSKFDESGMFAFKIIKRIFPSTYHSYIFGSKVKTELKCSRCNYVPEKGEYRITFKEEKRPEFLTSILKLLIRIILMVDLRYVLTARLRCLRKKIQRCITKQDRVE